MYFLCIQQYFIYLYIYCRDIINEKAPKIDAAEVALQGQSLRIPAWSPAGNGAGTPWDVPGQEVALVAQSGWAGGDGTSAVPREGRGEDVTDRGYGKGIFINFHWPLVQSQLIFMGNLIQESNLT